jgi:hypothetical protein
MVLIEENINCSLNLGEGCMHHIYSWSLLLLSLPTRKKLNFYVGHSKYVARTLIGEK